MPSLFLALIASALATLGTRQARLMAQLSARLGGGVGLLGVGWLSSIATSVLAAWAGTAITGQMPPAGKTMFVAVALALAGLELVWPMRKATLPNNTTSVSGPDKSKLEPAGSPPLQAFIHSL